MTQGCSRCGDSLDRIGRRFHERVISSLVIVHRFQCTECGWSGLRIIDVRRLRIAIVLAAVVALIAVGLAGHRATGEPGHRNQENARSRPRPDRQTERGGAPSTTS